MTGWEVSEIGQMYDSNFDLEKFTNSYSLSALSSFKDSLFIVRKYHPNYNCNPEHELYKTNDYRWCLAYYTLDSYTFFHLPKELEYYGIELVGDEFIIMGHIILKTNKGNIETNIFELGKKMLHQEGISEKERENVFLNLFNERNTIHRKSITLTSITSRALGTLTQGEFDDLWESKPVKLPFYNNLQIPIKYKDFVPSEDKSFLKEADEAVQIFLSKTEADRLSWSKHIHQNCIDFLEMVEEDDSIEEWKRIPKNDIWNHLDIQEIHVSREPYEDKGIYIQLICDCEWEEEHGLQLVFNKNGDLIRVSAIDGHILE